MYLILKRRQKTLTDEIFLQVYSTVHARRKLYKDFNIINLINFLEN